MAALLGGQQQTSNNRLLSDLGMQSIASKRALDAAGSYADLASTLSEQTFDERHKRGVAFDDTAEFNRENSLAYQKDKADFQVKERDAALGREKDRVGAHNTQAATNLTNRGKAAELAWVPTQAASGIVGTAGQQGLDILQTEQATSDADKAQRAIEKQNERNWFQETFDPLEVF